jgi:ankyrin repeat protein
MITFIMNIINLVFFTVSFFISHALLSGDAYPPEQNHPLWHWDRPPWVDSEPNEASADENEDSNSDNDDHDHWDGPDHPGVIRLSNLFDFLEEPCEELFYAIFYHDIEALESLLEDQDNLELISEYYFLTPLFYAARIEAKEIVRLLLKKGANCYISGPKYCSIAHFCIAHKRASTLAVVLEHSKEFYSQLDYHGHTLLQSAVANADSCVFDVLLDYSDDNGESYLNISHKGREGNNALFNAAGNKNIWLIGRLIDRYHNQISNDDLVQQGQTIFHVIFGNIDTTDHRWCPNYDELMPLITNFPGLLNYINEKHHQTSLDILHQKKENCRFMLGVNNLRLIERLIATIKEHGAKTAEEVKISLIKSTSNHKKIF